MKCPNCNENLLMTDRNGVEIDYCPECRGVWLDRGELDKIVARSAQEPNPPSRESHQQRQPYQKDQQYHSQKKKGGFLGDLFDF